MKLEKIGEDLWRCLQGQGPRHWKVVALKKIRLDAEDEDPKRGYPRDLAAQRVATSEYCQVSFLLPYAPAPNPPTRTHACPRRASAVSSMWWAGMGKRWAPRGLHFARVTSVILPLLLKIHIVHRAPPHQHSAPPPRPPLPPRCLLSFLHSQIACATLCCVFLCSCGMYRLYDVVHTERKLTWSLSTLTRPEEIFGCMPWWSGASCNALIPVPTYPWCCILPSTVCCTTTLNRKIY